MKQRNLRKFIPFLLLSIPFITSCTGQNSTDLDNTQFVESVTQGTQLTKVTKSLSTLNGPAENVHCGFLAKSGDLWFGTTGHGVFKFDGKSFTNYTEKDGLGGNMVMTICEDSIGNILIGTDKGIALYDGKSISSFAKHQISASSRIRQLYTDKKGQIWIATDDKGVFIGNTKNSTNLLSNQNVKNDFGLTLTSVSDILEDKNGNIWFASWAPSDEGIVRFDGNSLVRYTGMHGINDSLIHCILEDKSGILWLGSRNHGVFRYDGNSFKHLADTNGPGISTVYKILEDKNGVIWFATEANGVYCYDGEHFKNYTMEDGLINNSVFSMVEDTAGNLWFGTRNVGLCRFDGKSFVHFSE